MQTEISDLRLLFVSPNNPSDIFSTTEEMLASRITGLRQR